MRYPDHPLSEEPSNASNSFRLTFANVVSMMALFVALATGGAYAANEWTGDNIVNGSLTTADYKNDDIRGEDVRNENLTNADILDGTLLGGDIRNGTLGTNDYGDNSIDTLDITNGTITGNDIAAASITGGRLAPNGITTGHIFDGEVYSADIRDETLTSADIDEAQVSGLDRCDAATLRRGTICAGSDGNARDWRDAMEYCAPFGLRLPTLGEAMLLGRMYNVPGVADGEQFWTDGYFRDADLDFPPRVSTVRESGVHGDQAADADLAETVCVTDPYN